MTEVATFHDLKGASVFITGGGSGIGASLTEGFLQQGANVAFVQQSSADEFVQEMQSKYASSILFMPCDITDITRLQSCIDQTVDVHGPIDVLVNNAGNDRRHKLESTSVDEWDQAINVNLRPHFFTAQAVAKNMAEQGGGSIINLSSVSYLMGNAGYPAYVASKAGITGLTRALARELGSDNIRVNALLPGWVMTPRQIELWVTPKSLEEQLHRQCLKEQIQPEDIIDSTLFLASKASRMITGQAIVVDGGVVVTG